MQVAQLQEEFVEIDMRIAEKYGMEEPPTPIDPNSSFGKLVDQVFNDIKMKKTIPIRDAVLQLIDEED